MPTQGKACWQIKAKEEVLFCDRPYIKDKNHPKAEEKKSHLLKFFFEKKVMYPSVCRVSEGGQRDQKRALEPWACS